MKCKLLFFLILIFSCSQGRQFIVSDSIMTIVYEGERMYEEQYGNCSKDITYIIEYGRFECAYSDSAYGCCHRIDNHCDITIDFGYPDKCRRYEAVMHELYHCCKEEGEHGGWVEDITNYINEKCYD